MPRKAKARYLLDIRPRDSDAPGFLDLHLDLVNVQRELAGNAPLDRLSARSKELTRQDVLRDHVPGAYLDPATGQMEFNAGYDPAYDAGLLEIVLWKLVRGEVAHEARASAT